jgi:hypothetical protein
MVTDHDSHHTQAMAAAWLAIARWYERKCVTITTSFCASFGDLAEHKTCLQRTASYWVGEIVVMIALPHRLAANTSR